MIGSIVVVGVLTRCALLHPLYDLKAAQMNIQSSLFREHVFRGLTRAMSMKGPKVFVMR